MSAYSSSLRKPLIRNHNALRSEYSDSMMKNTGRAENRLQEQFKELERARKVIEADLRKQKSVIAASYKPGRRSSYPIVHAKIHGKILAGKASAGQRLDNFYAQSLSRSRPDKAGDEEEKQDVHFTRAPKSGRMRSHTADARLTSCESASGFSNTPSGNDLPDYTMSRHNLNLGEDEEDDSYECVEKQRGARKKHREQFFDNLSKPKHPVQDRKSMRAKIEEDMEKTRKAQRRKCRTVSSYTSDASH